MFLYIWYSNQRNSNARPLYIQVKSWSKSEEIPLRKHTIHHSIVAQIKRWGVRRGRYHHPLFLEVERLRLDRFAFHVEPPASREDTTVMGCGRWRRYWSILRMIGAHDATKPRRKIVMFCQCLDIELVKRPCRWRSDAYQHHILLLFGGPNVA